MNATTGNKLMFAERRSSVTWPQVRRFISRATLWTFATLGVIYTAILIFDLALIAMINNMP